MADDILIYRLKSPRILSTGPRYPYTFKLTKEPRRIAGVFKLLQEVVKILLTTPGTDIFRPDLGGGLKQLIKRPVSRGNLDTVRSEFALAIHTTQEQIKELQFGIQIPANERLTELEILGIDFNFETLIWDVHIFVHTESGDGVPFNLADVFQSGPGGI